MSTLSISKSLLMSLADELMDGHVSYDFGSKPLLTKEPSQITKCDCSGFVRYLLYRATDKTTIMPAGSWHQEEWCTSTGLPAVDYSTASNSDGWLRIAFLPKKNGKPRHVWFILNGLTIESRGGKGPDRRAWDTAVLKNNAHSCFKLAQLYTIEMPQAFYSPWDRHGMYCFPP